MHSAFCSIVWPGGLQLSASESLPESCFPIAGAANKLATLRARDLKAKILAPFPHINKHLFVPSWADDVCALACHACTWAFKLVVCRWAWVGDMLKWFRLLRVLPNPEGRSCLFFHHGMPTRQAPNPRSMVTTCKKEALHTQKRRQAASKKNAQRSQAQPHPMMGH